MAAGAEAIAFSKLTVNNQSDLALLLSESGRGSGAHFACADERLIRFLIRHLNKIIAYGRGFDRMRSARNVEFAAETVLALPPRFIPFTITASTWKKQEPTWCEEIGFTLAAGVDYLAAMQERGVDAARAAAAIEFGFRHRREITFSQIAKLRAFRMLWARAVESFGGTGKRREHALQRAPRAGTRRSTTRA